MLTSTGRHFTMWFDECEGKPDNLDFGASSEWERLHKIIPLVGSELRHLRPIYKENHTYRIKGGDGEFRDLPELREGMFYALRKFDECTAYQRMDVYYQYVVVWLKVSKRFGNMRMGTEMYVEKSMGYDEMTRFKYSLRDKNKLIHYTGLLIHNDEKDENGLTLPAILCDDGSKEWWLNGLLDRKDKYPDGRTMPNIITETGRHEWWTLNPRMLPKSEPVWYPHDILRIVSINPTACFDELGTDVPLQKANA